MDLNDATKTATRKSQGLRFQVHMGTGGHGYWDRINTHDNSAIGCALFLQTRWCKNCGAATKTDRVMKIWRFDFFCIPIFMNFDELNINYELILSKISKKGLKTHALPWLRDNKIHIIGPRHYQYGMSAAQCRQRLYTLIRTRLYM
jgi:hypothetical protein